MSSLKSHRQIWGKDFPIGGEWDAGVTPPQVTPADSGRWTVRREVDCFVVFFRRFATGEETLLESFPSTEQGELDAKACAITAHENLQIPLQNKEYQP